MRYFEPMVTLGILLPAQTKLEEKFGGLPWGLPAERWPLCTACKNPQTLIAQLVHDGERLDLGAPGRVLFVFQCNHNPGTCETWATRSGANACVILDATELRSGLTPVPTPATETETEVRVSGWTADDDGVSVDDASAFFDEARYSTLDDDVRERVPFRTKAGSVPAWIQNSGEGPTPPWRFVLQFDSLHRFRGKPPTANDVGCTVTRKVGEKFKYEEPRQKKTGAPPWISVDEEGYHCGGASFGDAGMAYVFIRTDGSHAEGAFFWQCG